MHEKTEKPSSHRLKKARQKGEIAQSTELATAVILMGVLLLLWGSSSLFGLRFREVFIAGFGQLATESVEGAFWNVFSPILKPVLLIFLGAVFLAIAGHFFQTGWIWKWRKKGKKAKPRLVYSLLKIGSIGLIAYLFMRAQKPDLGFIFAPSEKKFVFLLERAFALLFFICLALLILGICDFFYQKWKFYKQMYMTQQEKRDELRETEGDQQIKQRHRQKNTP